MEKKYVICSHIKLYFHIKMGNNTSTLPDAVIDDSPILTTQVSYVRVGEGKMGCLLH